MRSWGELSILGSLGVHFNEDLREQHTHTVVIGGGQAGLSVGYHLAKRGIPFVILDAHPRVGDAWRNRWDSLRLFTPSRYAGLPGFPFPGRGDAFLTKDEVADYLESYAQRFHLPVKNGVKVDSLSKEGQRFVTTAGDLRFESANVVVAMANYQVPRVPDFARELDPAVVQLHFTITEIPRNCGTAACLSWAWEILALISASKLRSHIPPGCRAKSRATSRFALKLFLPATFWFDWFASLVITS